MKKSNGLIFSVLENFARSSEVPVSDVYYRFKIFKPGTVLLSCNIPCFNKYKFGKCDLMP